MLRQQGIHIQMLYRCDVKHSFQFDENDIDE